MHALVPTKEQQAAIDHPDSLVAIANPGSGKTAVLAVKVQNILSSAPSYRGVIAISYTNKASDELRSRIASRATNLCASYFGTIDRFCLGEIISPFASHLWGKPEREIETERIKDLPEEEQNDFADIQENQMSLEDVENHTGLLKDWYLKGRIFLESSGALALYVIENSISCQRFLRARFSHIIIDEYQDSGLEQHQLFLRLKALGLVAIAVGDANQSIFGFSNKDPKHLLSLVNEDGFETFPITHNHRCHPAIINYSLRFLKINSLPLHADEHRVFKKTCAGHAGNIGKWIGGVLPIIAKKYGVKKMSDIGILVRSETSGDLVDAALTIKRRYFASHPIDNVSSLWGRLFKDLLTYRYDEKTTAQAILDAHGLKVTEGAKNARTLIKKLREGSDDSLFDKMEEVAAVLYPNASKLEPVKILRDTTPGQYAKLFTPAADDEVQVMTLHKSKGLEFDVVFHLDLYAWAFPAKGPGPGNNWNAPEFLSWDQDSNLHYVGITRARKACFLCNSTQRVNGKGETKTGSPSEFLTFNGVEQLRENCGL